MSKELTIGIIGDEDEETNIQCAIDDAGTRDTITYLRSDDGRIAAIVPAAIAEQYERVVAGQQAEDRRRCPDGGSCHHGCSLGCFRVITCGPLSGVYPGDRWPDTVIQAEFSNDGVL